MCNTLNSNLLLQIQLLYDRRITARIILFEIIQMRLAIGHHAQKAAARVVILAVLPQMRGQFIDALGQYGHLHLRRASVLVVDAGFLDDLCLLPCA